MCSVPECLLQFKLCSLTESVCRRFLGEAKESSYLTVIHLLCFSEMPQKWWTLIREQHKAGWQLGRGKCHSQQLSRGRRLTGRRPQARPGLCCQEEWDNSATAAFHEGRLGFQLGERSCSRSL